jgi:hypothetical protein
MNEKNVDFLIPVVNSHTDELFCSELGKQLVTKGYNPVFVTCKSSADELLKGAGLPTYNLCDVETDECDLLQEASRLRNSINIPNFRSVYFCERQYCHGKGKEEEWYNRAIKYAIASEYLLNSLRPRYILHNLGGEIIRRILYEFGISMGIPNIFAIPSPINRKVFFALSSTACLDHSIMQKEMSDIDEVACKNYLDNFRQSKHKIGVYFKGNEKGLRQLVSNMKSSYNTYNMMDISLLDGLNILITSRSKRLLGKFFYPSVDESINLCSNKKYIFFPIQYVKESRISVHAPNYFNLGYIIDILARSLPDGYYLFVKDHPDCICDLPIESIYRISRTKNVIWLSPNINSHYVIQNSSAVITINGTIGYEALLYGKPVIALGQEYYTGHGLTIDVRDLSNINEIMAKAINSQIEDNQLILKFINMIIKSSYSGFWGIVSNDNISKFTDSLMMYIETINDEIVRYKK